MAEPTLYDHLNRPVQRQALRQELAAPTLTGVRTIWDASVAGGLTPARLGVILQNAAAGEFDDYLTLAEEIEERDPHYACELSKRKLAVSRLPITVEAYSDSAEDVKLADAVRDLMRRPGVRSLIKDLLDGIAKGYSVCEIIWDKKTSPWLPARYEWRDPRWFTFDRISRREIRLRDAANVGEGIPLAPYKFICHLPHIKTGIPIRGGVARVAAWAWICKSYTVKDWLAFVEVFGMPLRVGKYQSGALQGDIDILKMAVANLGSDAAAVMPESMLVELVERKGTGGEGIFKGLAEYLDAQVSKLLLGQTATTQGTPGKLGNEESQAEVRHDIRDDDADQLAETINRDLVRPFIDLNYGPKQNYPSVQLKAPAREDITVLTTALKDLVPLGLKVEQSVVRDKLGLPDPEDGAELLIPRSDNKEDSKIYEYHLQYGVVSPNETRKKLGPAPQAGGDGKAVDVTQQAQAANRALAIAANQALPLAASYPPDSIADRLEVEAQPLITEWLLTVKTMLDQAESLEHFRALLLAAYFDLPTKDLAAVLTAAMTAADAAGRFDVLESSDG